LGEEKKNAKNIKRQQFRHIGAFESLTRSFNPTAPISSAPKTKKNDIGEETSRHSFA
jgi:hypothetical protein